MSEAQPVPVPDLTCTCPPHHIGTCAACVERVKAKRAREGFFCQCQGTEMCGPCRKVVEARLEYALEHSGIFNIGSGIYNWPARLRMPERAPSAPDKAAADDIRHALGIADMALGQ